MEKKLIEVEGDEMAIFSTTGIMAIVPKNKVNWVKKKLNEGCHECIDSFIETLPDFDNQGQKAEDGVVMDTDPPTTGESQDRMKKRLLNKYPGMQDVYGSEGQNLNIIKDRGFIPKDYGYGDIEFIDPGTGLVSYTDEYKYQSPTPDKYTVVYNPRGANRKDVALDMLHGMRDDENYMNMLDSFAKSVRDARGDDMQYFYNEDLKNGFAQDGQKTWDENYIDGLLRAELARYMARGREDYKMERSASSPEMIERAKDIYNYIRGKEGSSGTSSQDGSSNKPKTPKDK